MATTKILGSPKLHVHADVIRKSTDKEVGPLLRRHARRMACQGLETVGEVLHRGGEGKAAELCQAAPANRRPKAKEAELAEALPRGHAALVLLEGVVPGLGCTAEVVGCQPSALRHERALATEKLLTLVEPVKRVLCAIISGKIDLGEPWRRLGRRAMTDRLGGAEQ